VNWKRSQSTITDAIETTSTPMSWRENATPPAWYTVVPNGASMNFRSAPQIHVTMPSMRMKRPTVTITTAMIDCCTARTNTSCTSTPKTNAIGSVTKNASQYESPQSVSW